MESKYWSLVAGVACTALLLGPSPASAQVLLGTAQSFAVLGGSTVTNTGATTVTGDLGVSPGAAVTGFPPGLVIGGTIHAADAVALQAQNDVTAAYTFLALQPPTSDLTSINLGALTLTPGVYSFSTSAQLTGTLMLDAQGDPSAVFIFQIGSTLTTASNSSVALMNGAEDCNVFWQVGSSATLGTGTTFVGNILALTSITLNTGASVSGRALARNGAVTLDDNAVAAANCAVSPLFPPSLSKIFSPAIINAGGTSTLTITLSNPNTSVATLTSPLTDTLPLGVVVAATPNASTTCGTLVPPLPGDTAVTLSAGAIPAGVGATAGFCTITVDVSAAAPGRYLNTIAAGTLVTSNGTNGAPASGTLAAIDITATPPTISKLFNPSTISQIVDPTLTITLCNPNPNPADLIAPLTDTLPPGLVIAPFSNASTTCPGSGAVAATVGGTTVVLPATRSIPASGCCTVTVNVIPTTPGQFINTLPINALQTTNGNNTAAASTLLTVVLSTPLLSEWAMIMLIALLALVAFAAMRREAM